MVSESTADLIRFENTIGGQPAGAAGSWFTTVDPNTGQPWAQIPKCGPNDVNAAVEAARNAFYDPAWRDITATARGQLLNRLADIIAEEAERLIALEVRDNGKLIQEVRGQLNYIPQWFRYFGGLADKIQGDVLPIDKPGMHAHTCREPLGVVACITPWNSPLMLLTWKLAPALAAGNTCVVKPSEHTSASTLAFLALFEKAGFPPGVVNSVTGFPAEVGEPLVRHPDVRKVAFTGGDAGGLSVYRSAAEGLKPVTLELGGKSPNIIFEDANLENAVNGAISGIFAATGQTCIAGSRLLVQRSVHDQVVERLVELAKTAIMGDPKRADTQVGPVTTQPQLQRILDYIQIARDEGAQCVLGGGVPDASTLGGGWFVEPTVLTGVNNQMRIAREEVFGPVLAVIPFDDEAEALSIANDSPYGLAAGVWTSDIGRSLRMSNRLEAGTVWINCYRAASFLAPFGGYKSSGIGRENGQEAIDAYLQTKTVWIDTTGKVANPFVMR
ncbi:aldehyde dehydrogenase [Pseudomaricurvus alkylphenolicus]|uniref:aldehyde dehydrogenase n=1 Tax=Pseudomaricurvus alkylphenolicus TaxID=1306991 RepID=UPI00142496B1|nr:aldehyde dehydrogenase [Pseudomaricurvus alkylphenolicus]NIB40535.1 aldehyde dehydrogenase [Pseudomaricurvus alkylphenolicus]